MGIWTRLTQIYGKTPLDWIVSIRTKPVRYEDFPRIHASQLSISGKSSLFAKENLQHPFLKWEHYFEIYDRLFQEFMETRIKHSDSKVKFLEIGVDRGGSMRLWQNLLQGQADIWGIDINPKCAEIDNVGAIVRIGSQDDGEFLKKVVAEMGKLHIVLDDGSHASKHIIKSFQTLFPIMEENGIYIIEDVHASYWNYWSLGGGLRRRRSAIEYFKVKLDEIHQPYFRGKARSRHFKESPIEGIDSIEFFDSIIVVRKGKKRSIPTLVESGPGNGDFGVKTT